MGRSIGGFVAGVVVLFLVVAVIQTISLQFYPFPMGLDPTSPDHQEAVAAHLAGLPIGAFLFGFFSEILGALAGAMTAFAIAKEHRRILAAMVCFLALGGSIGNWMTFAHPMWFMVAQPIGYLAAFYGAVTLGALIRNDPVAAEPEPVDEG